MIDLLAQLETDQDSLSKAAEGAYNISLIILIGVIAVLFLVCVALVRRWGVRRRKAIEQDKAQRRAMQSASAGRVDAWSAGSDRYVDHDKLPDELPYDTEPDSEALDDDFEEIEDGDDRPGSGMMGGDEPAYEDEHEERDPYGLFHDKPYEDPDDADDDDDFDDEDFGDGFADDDPRR